MSLLQPSHALALPDGTIRKNTVSNIKIYIVLFVDKGRLLRTPSAFVGLMNDLNINSAHVGT